MADQDATPDTTSGKPVPPKQLECGLIMPISPIDSCTVEHWAEVKAIITDAVRSIDDPSFAVKLVSDADDIGIIQKRIVQNLYGADIIICDVSGKNPNVMFELGMRLAFDKPTVIVKDDKTDYSFDTGIIEHVGYPRDLRYPKITEFKRVLADKVASSYRRSQTDPTHSTFLKSFGQFHVSKLAETPVSTDKFIMQALEDIQSEMRQMRRRIRPTESRTVHRAKEIVVLSSIKDAIKEYAANNGISDISKLLGDFNFYSAIENAINGWDHFGSQSECHESVESVLRGLI